MLTQREQRKAAKAFTQKWAGISPTIFGAVFESTLNFQTRRVGGMHYTFLENIQKLKALREKMAWLCFLDSAVGFRVVIITRADGKDADWVSALY